MYNQSLYAKNRFKPAIIALICFIVGVIIISVLAMSGIFHRNPYGNEIKIKDFSKEVKNIPDDTRDALFFALYSEVSQNYHGEINISKLTGIIRSGSVTTEDSLSSQSATSNFLVDLPEIEQTYHLYVTIPTNNSTDALIGYSTVVLCPTISELIYPPFECTDINSDEPTTSLIEKYPIMSKLPIKEAFFNDDASEYFEYSIRYETNESGTDVSFVITDNTGNCYDYAIKRLHDEGVNTEASKIIYNNLSSGFTTPY